MQKKYCSICFGILDPHKEELCQQQKDKGLFRILKLMDTKTTIDLVDPLLITVIEEQMPGADNYNLWFIPEWLFLLLKNCRKNDIDFTSEVIKDYLKEKNNN